MAQLEQIVKGTQLKGLVPGATVTVVSVDRHGADSISVTFRDPDGTVHQPELLYRSDEPNIEVVEGASAWTFDGDGELLRLVSEARRIKLAHLFDPYLAVHTSAVEPLPHQITAVYEAMLPRRPLRFLLADDPGAGKTIMAGLLIKELIARSDLKRCLIVAPGSLVEQWQDELRLKFDLGFDLLTKEKFDTSQTGNPFREHRLLIARLDQLSRNLERLAPLFDEVEWDLVIFDEAHKLSSPFFGDDFQNTKRYELGRYLGDPTRTRQLLLMTATPHNGKEIEFQRFLALLDPDRFEGKHREGVHEKQHLDVMRRMVKEELLRMDGRPLFPERRAYTAAYQLTELERELYEAVTAYVREEMNRAEKLQGQHRAVVGFALTTLQRRLASSPEAILRSIQRRRERLNKRLREVQQGKSDEDLARRSREWVPGFETTDFDDLEDEATAEELEQAQDDLTDQATAAQTVHELQAEIESLRGLEALAARVRAADTDRKWDELRKVLLDQAQLLKQDDAVRKMIIFTEHRDTMNYLTDKCRSLLGRPEAVVNICGGMNRVQRKQAEEAFKNEPQRLLLIATDAAGEGINLQRANLMVNYDLPWNPNRIEQRFGRIHRIGQREVCHLWNLVAEDTREGMVFKRLCDKLETQSKALDGKVFDVLGKDPFRDQPLRELLIEAIRYGDQPEVRDRINRKVDAQFDPARYEELLDQSLVTDHMTAATAQQVRDALQRAETRKLQPYFVCSFFLQGLTTLGGRYRRRETDRFELTHVPADIRHRAEAIDPRLPVTAKYERVCFRRDLCAVDGKPLAEFLSPGHPLFDAVIAMLVEKNRDLLRRGAVLVDPNDEGVEPRLLFYLEHVVQDARVTESGDRHPVSTEMHFVEMNAHGEFVIAGYAPYLNYDPLPADLGQSAATLFADAAWLHDDVEAKAMTFAIEKVVPRHLGEVKQRRWAQVDRTRAAVKERLTKEIALWDKKARELKDQELAGKKTKLASGQARQRADELSERLDRRMRELDQERQISSRPPVIVGGALIVPKGLVDRWQGKETTSEQVSAEARKRVELLAMDAVMAAERNLGHNPRDVSVQKQGYDIESRDPTTGDLNFIEVKGRRAGEQTVTVTRNELLSALNKQGRFILAIVFVDGDKVSKPIYQEQFDYEMYQFAMTSVTLDLPKLVGKAELTRR
ncbi:MAG: DUF3883 domain-containing protein [Deltaproteobacteria bacterium]|nr:DUF3883 domain-containing protein [Deltaproteobacteria bacterium]